REPGDRRPTARTGNRLPKRWAYARKLAPAHPTIHMQSTTRSLPFAVCGSDGVRYDKHDSILSGVGRSMLSSKNGEVWVVIHCEIMQFGDTPVIDEMVLHVSSTKRRAERYIKGRSVMDYSWWKIQRYRVDTVNDDDDDHGPVFCYTHRGTAIQSPPIKRAISRFKKQREV